MAFKFNPFTGTFDIVGESSGSTSPDNFSYELVQSAVTVTVPFAQQMIVHNFLQVDGTLVLNGTLVMI